MFVIVVTVNQLSPRICSTPFSLLTSKKAPPLLVMLNQILSNCLESDASIHDIRHDSGIILLCVCSFLENLQFLTDTLLFDQLILS